MALIQFQQTGTSIATPPGLVTSCSGIAVGASAIGKLASVGGAAGAAAYFVTVDKWANSLYLFCKCDISDAYCLYNYPILDQLTYRLNVITPSASVKWTGIWVCLHGNNHTNKTAIGGTAALGTVLSKTKVYSVTLGLNVYTGQHFMGDYIYIAIRLQETSGVDTTMSFKYDQLIDIDMKNESPPGISEIQPKCIQHQDEVELVGYDG